MFDALNLRPGIVAVGVLLLGAEFLVFPPQTAAGFAVAALIGFATAFFGVTQRSAAMRATDAGDAAAKSNDFSSVQSEPASAQVLLTAMMGSMREGVIVIEDDMRVVASNPAAAAIFAHIDAPLENRRLSELTRNLEVHTAFQAAVTRSELSEVKVETRGDEKQMFDLRVAPLIFGDHGASRRPSAIGIFFDISQLERLERVRQEFLSNVSHELRTPLTSIIAFVETLEDGAIDDPENNLRFLDVIRRNAERMHRLINDILELSAIEAGRIAVQPRVIKLAALVDEITDILETTADERKITIENNVPPDAAVFADAVRLEQMIVNLMDNAVKFNRENGSVTIGFERDAAQGRDRIIVADSGEGISGEHVERIFERFYRVDKARSRDIGGTGLGLAIVKHLVKLHGGEVSARSTPGKGSTFTIELPAAKAAEATAEQR